MKDTPPTIADGPDCPGPRGRFEQRPDGNEAPRCASCGEPAETVVYATLLNGGVRVSIGACPRHSPATDDDALDLLDTALRAIAGAVVEADQAAKQCRREPRRD